MAQTLQFSELGVGLPKKARSIVDMFIISFRGFINSMRGKALWQIVWLSLVWFVWQERNARIFENKERFEGKV